MKNNKKKGYALAMVIILSLIMTIVVTSAFTIIMRYMNYAKSNTESLSGRAIYCCLAPEVDANDNL